MENKKDNNDIEELNLNDVEIEIKPQDINLEIKSVNPQSSLTDETIENLDFNEDNSSLENDQSVEQKGLSESASPSSDNSSVSDQGDKIFDDDSNASSDSQSTASSSSNDEISPSADDEKGSDNIDNDFDSKNNESSGKDNSDESQKSDSGDLQKNNQNKEDKNLNQKDKNTNKKDNNPSNDKNLDNKQNVDKNQNNKKDDVNKEPKKERNEDKNKIGNQGDKKPSGNKHSSNLKDRWNNRPKSPKDFANRAKNGIKNGAKNRFNNSKAGRAINKGKKAVEEAGKKAVQGAKKAATAVKTAVSFFSTPAGWITLAVIAGLLLILVITIMVPSMFASGSPLLGGEVSNEENYSKYSEVDQETIDKLKDITDNYVSGDPALAMVTVVYPYIEELQDGNVSSLRGKTNVEQQDSEDEEEDDSSSQNNQESQDDTTDLEDNQNDITADDPYLELFRKWTYRNKFKKLLKETEKGEKSYIEHLKKDYFDSDKGYKEMFDGCEDEEALADAIIDDLLELKEDFNGYFFENCITSNASTTPLNAAGNVESLKGSIYVTLRDYFADSDGTFRINSYYNSPVLYSTDFEPLTFARYIMGVVYAESESCLNSESCAKTLMITAKSFAIGRQTSMGYDPEYIESENKTIIHMRGNVGDQDFCDVYEGCETGRFSKDSWQTFTGEGYKNRKGPLASDKLANLEKWWNEIADQYVVNKESGKFVGNQYSDYNDSCKQGNCVSQTLLKESSEKENDYKNLLFNPLNGGFDNSSYVLFTSSSNELYAVTTGNEVCDDGTLTASRQKIVNFAKSMVGQIPYYFYEGNSDGYGALGHALSKNFDDNHFGELTSITDYAGRDKYGLDCSGFVDFVFWNVLDNNLGNGNTDTLKSVSIKIEYSDLKPGDLGFLNDGSSGTEQHVGIYVGDDKWIELNPNGVTEGPYPDFKVYYRPNILVELDAKEAAQGDGISTGEMVSPIEGKSLTCSDYPYYSSGSYHGGTDLVVTEGTNVVAMDGGTVITSKDITSGDCSGNRHCNGGYYSYGRYIEIQHDNGLVTKYAHLSERLVEEGDKVSKGQLIGKSGNTGNSTGAHLHIEVIKDGNNQNPCDFIKK